MKSARIIEPRKIEVIDIERPEPKEGQILIKTTATSICGSDMPHFLHERPMNYPLPPGIPGHECIGIVEKSLCDEYKEGDNVLAIPAGSGGFSEYIISVPSVTVKIPSDSRKDEYVIAQPLGTVIHACRKLFNPLFHSGRGDRIDFNSWKLKGFNVAIVGQGAIGLLFTSLMRIFEADTIIGIDPVDYRLQTSLKMGATHIVNPKETNIQNSVKEITNGAMVDLAFEAVGKDSTVNDCISVARRGGVVLVFGCPRDPIYKLAFDEIQGKELKVLSSLGPEVQVEFPPAVQLIADGKIDASMLISHRLPFDEIQKGFEMAVNKTDNAIKIVLHFN